MLTEIDYIQRKTFVETKTSLQKNNEIFGSFSSRTSLTSTKTSVSNFD